MAELRVRRTFRADIEGLRAVAVILVVLDHVFGQPQGGFVGVDVFFVISGFLITSLLLREYERTGAISFWAFYLRRAKRILPAALLVIVVTCIASFVIYFHVRAVQVLWDGIASGLFVQNWHLIRAGTNYFAADGAASPLQHYWSLSVEEQFYVFWPWMLLLLLSLVARRASSRKVIRIAVGCAVVLSFAWSIIESATHPAWSYFSIESRAWELGAGAMLALSLPLLARIPGLVRAPLFYGGLLLVVVGALLISPQAQFPGPWGAIPVVGSMLVIVSGTGIAERRWMIPLTNPVSRYLGAISFSLYLWHYPAIIFMGALLPHSPVLYVTIALAITLVLSAASHRFVEEPFRKLPVHRPRFATRTPVLRRRLMAAVGGIVLLSLCAFQMRGPSWVVAGPSPAAASLANSTSQPDSEAISASIVKSSTATAWPDLTPSLDSVGFSDSGAEQYQRFGCLNDPVGMSVSDLRSKANSCTFGPKRATRTLVVLGDSIAISWMPAIRRALSGTRWRIIGIGLESCPASTVSVYDSLRRSTFPESCNAMRRAALAYVRGLHPDLVIVSNALGSIDRLVDGATGKAAQQQWQSGTTKTITSLTSSRTRVDLLQSPPESTPPTDCATRVLSPATCLSRPGADWFKKSRAEQASTRAAGVTPGEARFIPTISWFCTANYECPVFAADLLVKVDNGHLSSAYALRLAGVVRSALTGT